MTTSTEQMRAWAGPAILTFGFWPFFFGAGVWAALAMVLWVPMLSGDLTLATAFDPVSWHAHEFLFGYLGAVIAGFLLTAVPNWTGRLPVPPMQRFDKVTLIVLLLGLLAWVALPDHPVTAILLLLAGGLHLVRLARWAGDRTLVEPLVAVLHLGYVFLPLGAVANEAEIPMPRPLGTASAQHLWMGGAVGLMTLAVMTRATLGHTGQALTAGSGTVGISAALVGAVLARLAAGIWPDQAHLLHMAAGSGWIFAFGGFTVFCGPLLLRLPAAKRM